MKARIIVPVIILLAFSGQAALAQGPNNEGGQTPKAQNAQQFDQRFEEMSKIMGQAQNAKGAERAELSRKHLQLMQDQMPAMRSMMGAGMMGGEDASQNKAKTMTGDDSTTARENGGQNNAKRMMGGGMMRGGMMA